MPPSHYRAYVESFSVSEYEVSVVPLAVEQVTDAVAYVRDALTMPKAARQLFDELSSAIVGLSRMPNRFRAVYRDTRSHIVVRRRNVRKYAIFYLVDDRRKTVAVFAVLYGSPSDRRIAEMVRNFLESQ